MRGERAFARGLPFAQRQPSRRGSQRRGLSCGLGAEVGRRPRRGGRRGGGRGVRGLGGAEGARGGAGLCASCGLPLSCVVPHVRGGCVRRWRWLSGRRRSWRWRSTPRASSRVTSFAISCSRAPSRCALWACPSLVWRGYARARLPQIHLDFEFITESTVRMDKVRLAVVRLQARGLIHLALPRSMSGRPCTSCSSGCQLCDQVGQLTCLESLPSDRGAVCADEKSGYVVRACSLRRGAGAHCSTCVFPDPLKLVGGYGVWLSLLACVLSLLQIAMSDLGLYCKYFPTEFQMQYTLRVVRFVPVLVSSCVCACSHVCACMCLYVSAPLPFSSSSMRCSGAHPEQQWLEPSDGKQTFGALPASPLRLIVSLLVAVRAFFCGIFVAVSLLVAVAPSVGVRRQRGCASQFDPEQLAKYFVPVFDPTELKCSCEGRAWRDFFSLFPPRTCVSACGLASCQQRTNPDPASDKYCPCFSRERSGCTARRVPVCEPQPQPTVWPPLLVRRRLHAATRGAQAARAVGGRAARDRGGRRLKHVQLCIDQ